MCVSVNDVAICGMKKTILGIIFISICITLNATDREKLADNKAKFIIDISQKVYYTGEHTSESYKIGVYGKSKITDDLYEALLRKQSSLRIHGKPVEIFQFKRSRQLEPVDLIYIEGNSKIRINDINKRLKDYPYILLTENYPYGTSFFNIVVDEKKDIMYELQVEPLERKGVYIDESVVNSKKRITTEEQWNKKLETAIEIVQQQNATIMVQQEEMLEQAETINYQRRMIILASVFIAIICFLIVFLLKSIRKRNEALSIIEQKNKDIIDSIRYTERIQNAILPPTSVINGHFHNNFIIYKPKDIISGDFYWLENEGHYVSFAVADCTGHGVPGAMVSVMCSSALTKTIKELRIIQPSLMLDETAVILDKKLCNGETNIPDGMDVALCTLNKESSELQYAGANNALYIVRNNKVLVYKSDRQAIGDMKNRKPYTNHTIQLKKGDCIYLFSDGIVDQFGGPDNKKYKTNRFKALLLKNADKPMQEQMSIIEKEFSAWKGCNEQVDDICVMGIGL